MQKIDRIVMNAVSSTRYFHEARNATLQSKHRLWLPFPIALARITWRHIIKRKRYTDIPYLNFVLTEKCSLRCKNCTSLMQYFGESTVPAQTYPLAQLISDFEKLITLTDRIYKLSVIGGEPLVHPELSEFLRHVSGEKKVKKIVVITNGTIVPNDELVQVLKNPKILVSVSWYGEVSRQYDEVLRVLAHNGINYRAYKEPMIWQDKGEIFKKDLSLEQLKSSYNDCFFKCSTIMDGRLYNCPCYASGAMLGLIPRLEEDTIDVRNNNKSEFTTAINKFFKRKYLAACAYCSDAEWTEAREVPGGIQWSREEWEEWHNNRKSTSI